VKVGDLVRDTSFGMNGVIFDVANEVDSRRGRPGCRLPRIWMVLYADGQTDEAYDDEIEIINESR